METKIEEVDVCKKKILIEVSNDEIKDELEKEFEKIKDNVVVPGFRKGRVPRKLIERRFNKQIEEEVKQNVISNSYQKALEDNKLVPLGMPEFGEIDFKLDQPLNFDITLEVKPEFEIENYRGLNLSKKKSNVTKSMIDKELERLSLQDAPLTVVTNGTIKKGDLIVCSAKTEVEGNIVLEEDNLDVNISSQTVGSVTVPDLEKALVGLKAGEETTINIKLGHDFKVDEYKGKNGDLTITIDDIKRPKAQKIDDDLAKKFKFDSLDDLKDKIQMELESQLKSVAERELYNQIMDKLLDLANFDLPKGIVNSMAEERAERYRTMLLNRGEPLDNDQDIMQKVKNESEDSVIKELKTSFIMEYIANKEKIFVTDTEVDKKIAEYARNYNVTPEKMYNYLEKKENIRSLRHQMREDKTMEFLIKEANFSDATTKGNKKEDEK